MDDERWQRYLRMRGEHAKPPSDIMTGHRLYTLTDFRESMGGIDVDIMRRFGRKSMLVVGCACGHEVEYMEATYGYDAQGVDFDGSQFDPKLRGKLHVMDMHDLTIGDGEFDRIFSCHSFEHSLSPYIVLQQYNRVLRMGGKAFISIPLPNDVWLNDPQHISVLTPMQMKYLAEKNGFVLLDGHETSMPEKRGDASQIFILEKVMEMWL